MAQTKEEKAPQSQPIEMKDKDGADAEDLAKEEKEEKEKARSPLMQTADWRYLLTLSDELVPKAEKEELKSKLLKQIDADDMAPFYKQLTEQFHWPFDEKHHAALKAKNEAELKRLEEKAQEAKANAGDTEVREFTLAKADYLGKIGDKEAAYQAYKDTLAITVGVGSRIDVVFTLIRVSLFHNDIQNVRHYIEQAKGFVEKGGDWERRNLLKIYEAIYNIMIREFKKASSLLLDSVATFTCYELFDYNTFVFYTVVTAIISVDRVTLKNKVVGASEILSAYRDIPNLEQFLTSLYKCRYRDFFSALSDISPQLQRDRFLASHFTYIVREIRVVAYKQFLQSYRSVTLQSMADSFGLSSDFLDKELSRFISNGRLNCKIDKVNGIVETNRPDAKNAQYQSTIKQGDLLLNRIQKLTKLISG